MPASYDISFAKIAVQNGLLSPEQAQAILKSLASGKILAQTAVEAKLLTREQAAKSARLARELGNGIVTIFLDCDPEGENGMKQCLGYLSQLVPVRLAWTSRMFAGKFKVRQPESLLVDEWREIVEYLRTGQAQG